MRVGTSGQKQVVIRSVITRSKIVIDAEGSDLFTQDTAIGEEARGVLPSEGCILEE